MTPDTLETKIAELTRQIKLQNSVRRNFLLSIVRGFGTALGATAVFGLVFALLFQVIRSIDYVPLLNNVLSSQAVEEVIRRFTQPL